MKKIIIVASFLVAILALGAIAFAFTSKSGVPSMNSVVVVDGDNDCCKMPNCCKDGKCSMSEDGKCKCDAHKAEHKCSADCCKDGKCSMSADGKCNCTGESCKMHGKDANGEHKCTADCCKDGKCSKSADGKCNMDCCKDGKCSMNKDGEAKKMMGDCCKGKDNCPMHKNANTNTK